jgi:glycosyltransferase involved in cell wall biosynthesis
LNKGIDLARSELIARMDADDISYPARLERQYAYFQKHPDVALVSCWARVIDEEARFVRLEKYETPYYYYNLTFECWIYHPTVIYKKTAVNSIGKYTELYSEDFELFWQISRKYKISNVEEVLVDYRITTTSLHQVIKKTEYDIAQEKQVMRNIAFYMGKDFQLANAELECLRHNFNPMLQQNNCSAIIRCLKKLDKISFAVLATDNINRDTKALHEAIWYKKNFIIDFFARNLPEYKAVIFLIRMNEWKKLQRLATDYIKRSFNS